MIIRIRLGSSLARLAPGPIRSVELPSGATVEDLYHRLAVSAPELSGALASAVAVVEGQHVGRDRTLSGDQEVALLVPVAGG
jgi:molybdopterin converting factor small subunit